MSSAAQTLISFSHFEQLREARAILHQEAAAIEKIAAQLDATFCAAVDLLLQCQGKVVVTGMGKAGLIGQKLAATLSSTGTSSHFLHPAEAVHGDLGCLRAEDVVLALSNSGETEELCRLLPIFKHLDVPVVSMTSSEKNTLGRASRIVLSLGKLREADQWSLAPSTTTTVMLALGDALALVVSRLKKFTPQQFAVFHPAGSLGQQLRRVTEAMRRGDQVRIAQETTTIRDVFTGLSRPGRRTGAVMLVDEEGKLSGLFTDSDLARLLEHRREFQLDRPISEVMTLQPMSIPFDRTLREAVDLFTEYKFSELPVVDADNMPVGLLDITDVIGLMPHSEE